MFKIDFYIYEFNRLKEAFEKKIIHSYFTDKKEIFDTIKEAFNSPFTEVTIKEVEKNES